MAVNLASSAILTAVSWFNWATTSPTPVTIPELEKLLDDIGGQIRSLKIAAAAFQTEDPDAFSTARIIYDAAYKLVSSLVRATTVTERLTPKPLPVEDARRFLGPLSDIATDITGALAILRAKRTDIATLSPQFSQAFGQSSDLVVIIGLVTLQKQYKYLEASMFELAPDEILPEARALATSVTTTVEATIAFYQTPIQA